MLKFEPNLNITIMGFFDFLRKLSNSWNKKEPNSIDKPNSALETTEKSTEQSKLRLTYLLPQEDKPGVYLEIDSTAKMLGFGDYFFSLSDWEQIKGIIEAFKKASNDSQDQTDTMFATWLMNEFRYMEYSFDDKFKLKFAEKIASYYRNGLTIIQLEEYFNNNVTWKE